MILEHGPWAAYERWPDPPETPRERHSGQLTNQYVLHYLRHRDPGEDLKICMQCVWFLCRYGMQSYRDVLTWPEAEVRRSMEYLGFWIEKESPKTTAGPS